MSLYNHVSFKDDFREFYQRLLAVRLTHGVTVSQYAELSMISKLKEACGWEYVKDLERMVAGMHLTLDRCFI